MEVLPQKKKIVKVEIYMKIKEDSLLLVKFFSPVYKKTAWREYRVSKGRNFNHLVSYFSSQDAFRFAILFSYDKLTHERVAQTGYFDKKKYWYQS